MDHTRPRFLDAGYFIVPASIANDSALFVGVRVLKEDFTVQSPVNATTIYTLDMDDYYQTG